MHNLLTLTLLLLAGCRGAIAAPRADGTRTDATPRGEFEYFEEDFPALRT